MTSTESTTQPNRRSVLCGLAAAVAVPGGLLVACGDSGSTGAARTSAAGGTSAAAPTGGGAASGLVALADVPVGGGVVVDGPSGDKLVVTRVSDTEVKAFDASCTHQGVLVGEPAGGTISCPAHGSQFDATSGGVKKGPATKPLTEVPVAVDGDQVVLA
ncbi:Rieske (2Fe-2S) protein [Umezawaea beigongshangensis]|uniref:Rieske (2Fe-2S) protein n=1 Tax=Umezawaea beigongshangensis TaxID=2780383 RepID=UPI0018F272B1|nr:Rieske (2Fe-2S) protein [Umezawaea beigongshangensis]